MSKGFDTTNLVYSGVAVSAALVAYYATRDSPKIDPLYDFDHQSIEIDEIERIRIAPSVKGKPLIEYRDENLRTLNDCLYMGLKISNDGPCLGYRKSAGSGPYVWIKYSEVIEKTRLIGSGLLNKGIKAENSTNIGIYSRNRIEWTICEYTCYSYSMNVVSLYDSYGKDSTKYILNQTEISAVFVDEFSRVMNIAHNIDELPYLRLIIHFDPFSEEQIKQLNLPSSVELIHLDKLMSFGRNDRRSPVPPKPSDHATICYTSGTTGMPKGAIITHGNIIANEAGLFTRLHKPHLNIIGTNAFVPIPIHYCYLPLAHMMERISVMAVLSKGGMIGYISGDLTTILSDCQELKPTRLALVPRLLNKLYDSVYSEVGHNKLKLMLLNRAIAKKEADRQRGIIRKDTIYDKLIFKKIQNMFGGAIVSIGTGSAPLSKAVKQFSRSAFGCPLTEGYGQTEATCALTFTHNLEPEPGHCGAPLDCAMMKLVDVPEMGYFAKDGKGEVCAKGPCIFKGYYKDPEKTAEAIDKDGWLHTGDIGQWLPNGCLKIIDRKKHLFKLSQGEYISPERIQAGYSRSPFVGQIFVDGDSLKDYCVAIVIPDEQYLRGYCQKFNLKGTFSELCKNKDIKKIIWNDMDLAAQNFGLLSFEKIGNMYLHDQLFTVENGFLTPTMKVKRNEIKKHFQPIIDRLYKEPAMRTTTKSKL